jgi:rubredoxin
MAKEPPKEKKKPGTPSARQVAHRWTCPKCARSFTQVNQRHACGTSDGSDVLRGRPESVVRAYAALEAFAKSLGPIELVARERYVLLRSVRIFADLVIMSDAVRVAIHLERKVDDPLFIKVVADRKRVTHVAKLLAEKDVEAIKAYLKEAYDSSLE